MTQNSQNNVNLSIVRPEFYQFDTPELYKKLPENSQEALKENAGRWTHEEHELFLKGLAKFGKGWKKIAGMISTRTVVQVRTHAQKYFQKLEKERQKVVAINIKADSIPTGSTDQMKNIEDKKSCDVPTEQPTIQTLNLVQGDQRKKDIFEHSEFSNSNNVQNSIDKGFNNLHFVPNNLPEKANSKQESGCLKPNMDYVKKISKNSDENCVIRDDVFSQQKPSLYSKPYKQLAPFPLVPLKTFAHDTFTDSSLTNSKSFKFSGGGSSPTSVEDISFLGMKGLPFGTMTPKNACEQTKTQIKAVSNTEVHAEIQDSDFLYDDLFDASTTLDWYFKEIYQNEMTDLSSATNISAIFNKGEETVLLLPKVEPEGIKDTLFNEMQNVEYVNSSNLYGSDGIEKKKLTEPLRLTSASYKLEEIEIKYGLDGFLQPPLKKCKFSLKNEIEDQLFEGDVNLFENMLFNIRG